MGDGVTRFLPSRHDTITGDLPQFSSLRLTMPVPEYLLGMKAMAARLGGLDGQPSDVEDRRLLIRRLGLRSSESVHELVRRYYPDARTPVKTQYLVEGLFEEKAS